MTGWPADALLPPVGLAIVTVALLVAGWRRAGLLTLLALALLSVQAVPHLLVAPLLRYVPIGSAAPGAIVVLSAGLPGLLDPAGTTPSLDTLVRLRAAAALQRRTGLPVLVSGARASRAPVAVGTAMAASLRDDFGVEPRWIETGSTNPWQSAAASAALLRDAGIDGAYLVVQPWENRLSTAVFGAAGLTAWPAPATGAVRQPLGWSGLLPTTPTWLYSANVIGQWAGLACQAVPLCVRTLTPGPS